MPDRGKRKPFLDTTLLALAAAVLTVLGGVTRIHTEGTGSGGLRTNPKDGLNYVKVPAGDFMMGCSASDEEFGDDEKPPHHVVIGSAFWINQTEVTAGAFMKFVGETHAPVPEASNFNAGWHDLDMPIFNVSWKDASAFCTWAGGRLPSEAEWEYAARAGASDARYGPIDEVAWYVKNSSLQTHEVAQKRANAFGLYDMLGNSWEWVNDWYADTYYRSSPERDPRGPNAGDLRVVRGGSWVNDAKYIRASTRNADDPTATSGGEGFRCVGATDAP